MATKAYACSIGEMDRAEGSTFSTPRDYITLLKPGVMALVVFSGFAGMMLAPGHVHPFLQLLTVLCIALGSGAGAVFNMWYDRDIDAVMARTQKRPIPSGRIHPEDALAFGWMLALASITLLGLAVSWQAAGLLAFAIFFYAVIYTMWLKRSTDQNIVIGGAAGAFPPVIGWLAMGGDILAWQPWVLFLIIFFWTPPHFWALALYRNQDYRDAHIPMLPVTKGVLATKNAMVFYTLLLVGTSLIPSFLDRTYYAYGVVAALAGGYLLFHMARVYVTDNKKYTMPMFGYTIIYLFLLLLALVCDHYFI